MEKEELEQGRHYDGIGGTSDDESTIMNDTGMLLRSDFLVVAFAAVKLCTVMSRGEFEQHNVVQSATEAQQPCCRDNSFVVNICTAVVLLKKVG